MTHTSTEQPEALRLAYEQKIGDWVVGTAQWCEEVANELIRLHARVLELEVSQARVPLSDGALDNAYLADQKIRGELSCFRAGARYAEQAHGITQEKQG